MLCLGDVVEVTLVFPCQVSGAELSSCLLRVIVDDVGFCVSKPEALFSERFEPVCLQSRSRPKSDRSGLLGGTFTKRMFGHDFGDGFRPKSFWGRFLRRV